METVYINFSVAITFHAFNFKVPLIIFRLLKRKSSQNLIKYRMGESDTKPQTCSHYCYQIFTVW